MPVLGRPIREYGIIMWLLAFFAPPIAVYNARTRHRARDTCCSLVLSMVWIPGVLHATYCVLTRSTGSVTGSATSSGTGTGVQTPLENQVTPYPPPQRRVTFHDQPQYSSDHQDTYPRLLPSPQRGSLKAKMQQQPAPILQLQREPALRVTGGVSQPLKHTRRMYPTDSDTRTIPSVIGTPGLSSSGLPELEHSSRSPSPTHSYIEGQPDILQTPQQSPSAPPRVYQPQDSPSNPSRQDQSSGYPPRANLTSPPSYKASEKSAARPSKPAPSSSAHTYPPAKPTGARKGDTKLRNLKPDTYPASQEGVFSYPPVPEVKRQDTPIRVPTTPRRTEDGLLASPYVGNLAGFGENLVPIGEASPSSSRKESDTIVPPRQTGQAPHPSPPVFSQDQYLKDFEEHEAKRKSRLEDEQRRIERQRKREEVQRRRL